MIVSNEFYQMASGGDGDGIREQYYPGWEDSDFQEVIDALE